MREWKTARHCEGTLQEAHYKEASKILSDSHQRGNDSPCKSQCGEPELRRSPLENDIARYFEQHISDEVECQASEVLIARHVEVCGETLNPRVGDYCLLAARTDVKESRESLPLLRSKNESR